MVTYPDRKQAFQVKKSEKKQYAFQNDTFQTELGSPTGEFKHPGREGKYGRN